MYLFTSSADLSTNCKIASNMLELLEAFGMEDASSDVFTAAVSLACASVPSLTSRMARRKAGCKSRTAEREY